MVQPFSTANYISYREDCTDRTILFSLYIAKQHAFIEFDICTVGSVFVFITTADLTSLLHNTKIEMCT